MDKKAVVSALDLIGDGFKQLAVALNTEVDENESTNPSGDTVKAEKKTPAKNKKAGKAQAEVAEKPAKVADESGVEDTSSAPAESEAPAKVDKPAMILALQNLQKAKGAKAVPELLKGFDVTRVGQLDPSQYGDVKAAAEAAL